MRVTVYSVITGIIIFNILIFFLTILRRNNKLIYLVSIDFLFFALILSIFRGVFAFEFKNALNMNMSFVLNKFYNVLFYKFNMGNFSLNIFNLLVSIWLIGFIIMTIKSARNYIKFSSSLNNIKVIEDIKANMLLENLKNILNIKFKIKVFKTNLIHSPFAVDNISEKTIYLPDIEFNDVELKNILLHEINHFINRDILKKIFIVFITNLFWFNPFIYVLRKEINQIIELRCDISTTKKFSIEEKINYVATIHSIMKRINTNSYFNNELVNNLYGDMELVNLKQRYEIVLNNSRNTKSYKIIFLYILFFITYILSYFIVLQPHYSPNEGGIYTLQSDHEKNFILYAEDVQTYYIFINNEMREIIKDTRKIHNDEIPIYNKKGGD